MGFPMDIGQMAAFGNLSVPQHLWDMHCSQMEEYAPLEGLFDRDDSAFIGMPF
jgi:hypothetical protein